MTRKELDVMTAIFHHLHEQENYAIRSNNDCWIEVVQVNVSREES